MCKYRLIYQKNQETVISASNVIQWFLWRHFTDNREISRYFGMMWPLPYLDLTPCDFGVLHYLKSIVYCKGVTYFSDLTYHKHQSLCLPFHTWACRASPGFFYSTMAMWNLKLIGTDINCDYFAINRICCPVLRVFVSVLHNIFHIKKHHLLQIITTIFFHDSSFSPIVSAPISVSFELWLKSGDSSK